MENLQPIVCQVYDNDPAALNTPFEPLTLQRPIQAFGKALDLTPGISAVPNPEFLTYLLTGHHNHAALIRNEVGNQFKNLENLLRGRHRTSGTTLRTLAAALGVSDAELASWSHGLADGPLLPRLLAGFQVLEELPLKLTTCLLATKVLCPHCGHNAIDDIDLWWKSQPAHLSQSEYRFAERLLRAATGAMLVFQFCNALRSDSLHHTQLSGLAKPGRHPIGNWLDTVRKACGCRTLSGLSDRMNLRGERDWLPSRLKKWSSGQNLIPNEAATALGKETGSPNSFAFLMILARALTLAVEFILAPAQGNIPPTKEQARQIVHDRLLQLENNLSLAIRQIGKNRNRT
ncbi:hypothetical protein [Thauera sp. 2A1]|uniref:hypothetical protein n=1 Tax=Thauera sp. 2A1 TaxID=2570191 RepID=UPI001290F10C|nr:hypothetical protein [Thauera sp. 2A1]KAI5915560.1 hypothetical protein GH664_06335 [Thauera sp. 2A1]